MNRNIDAWGDPNRHYAGPLMQPDAIHINPNWEEAVDAILPHSRTTVIRTVDLWNQKVRNQLSNEIGFQLRGRQVAVRVVDGLPEPLSECLCPFDDLAQMLLDRTLLEGVAAGTRFMESIWPNMVSLPARGDTTAELCEITRVRKTAHAWLRLANDQGLTESLRGINEDVLGAYFYNAATVKIYWLAIGIFAALYNVSIEALTFVVLAHELAHAYTHKGSDIDGYLWPTSGFASTDIAILEGLAQFYTEVVCENLATQVPDASDAFEMLMAHQNDIYKTHRTWVTKGNRDNGEIVRVSLVQCRRSGKAMHRDDFLETVRKRRSEITGRQ